MDSVETTSSQGPKPRGLSRRRVLLGLGALCALAAGFMVGPAQNRIAALPDYYFEDTFRRPRERAVLEQEPPRYLQSIVGTLCPDLRINLKLTPVKAYAQHLDVTVRDLRTGNELPIDFQQFSTGTLQLAGPNIFALSSREPVRLRIELRPKWGLPFLPPAKSYDATVFEGDCR